MRIDKIIPYGKTRSKVLFDEGLVLLFYNGEIKRMRLSEGADIPESVYAGEIVPILKKRARERLVYILKSSDKPENELRRKLKEGFYPQEAIDDAIEWAKSKKYVDDARYIDTYVRYHGDGKSKKKMLYDLQAKGLDKALILSVLEDCEVDESEQIRRELSRKHYSEDMDPKEKQKILMSLVRKGYSWSAVLAITGDVC